MVTWCNEPRNSSVLLLPSRRSLLRTTSFLHFVHSCVIYAVECSTRDDASSMKMLAENRLGCASSLIKNISDKYRICLGIHRKSSNFKLMEIERECYLII